MAFAAMGFKPETDRGTAPGEELFFLLRRGTVLHARRARVAQAAARLGRLSWHAALKAAMTTMGGLYTGAGLSV